MNYRLALWLLPAIVAAESFKTITTSAPAQTPLSLDGLPRGTYLASRANIHRRQDSGGACGLTGNDCGNGFCCETADSCAERRGQTVCLPAGISFADPVPAFRATSNDLSAVTPTSSSGDSTQTQSPTGVDQTSSSTDNTQTSSSPSATGDTSSPSAAQQTSVPAADSNGNNEAAGGRPDGGSSGGSSLSGGAIAGIVVGVVVAVLIIVGVLGYFVFKARRRDRVNYDEPASDVAPALVPAGATTQEKPAELEGVDRAELPGSNPEDKLGPNSVRPPQELPASVDGK